MHSARILAPLCCEGSVRALCEGSALSLVSLMVICRQSAAKRAMGYLACAHQERSGKEGEGKTKNKKMNNINLPSTVA